MVVMGLSIASAGDLFELCHDKKAVLLPTQAEREENAA